MILNELNIEPISKDEVKKISVMQEPNICKWTLKEFENCFKKGYSKMACVVNNEIVGYIIYEFRKKKVCLHKIYVKDRLRRQGIGTFLIDYIKDKLVKDRSTINVQLNERNLSLQLFLKNQGFVAQYILPDYYIKRYGHHLKKEDCYVMEFKQ